MTEAQRRYMHARNRIKSVHLDPIQELLDSTLEVYEDERKLREEAEDLLNTMRPVWAMGWTEDSQAAQASANALAELWELLDAKHQTEAIGRLKDLLEHERASSEDK